ncbi:MAG: hypothetical protein JNG84_07250 [Archangium sp.]|nr:hypothetical protein [Archangium sp.]
MPARVKNSPQARLNTYVGYEEKRIAQGIKEGTLTPAEAKTVKAQASALRGAMAEAMKDGFMSAPEEKALDTQLSILSNHVAELDQNSDNSAPEYALTLIGNSIFTATNSKDLTKAEAKALNSELAEVRAELQQARAAGELTPDDLKAITQATNGLADELKKNVKNAGRVVSKLGFELRLARMERRLARIENDPKSRRDHAVAKSELAICKDTIKEIRAKLTEALSDGALNAKERTKLKTQLKGVETFLWDARLTPAEWNS